MTRWRLFGLGAEAAEIWYTVGYLLSVLGHTNSNLLFFVILCLILLAFLLQFHKHKFYYITIYLWYSSPRFALVCFTIVFLLSSMSNTWGTATYVTPVLGEQCYMKRGLPTRPQFVTKNLLYRGNNTPRRHIFNVQSSALTAWQQRCSPHETLDWRLKGQSWFDKWKRRSLEAALCTCDPLSWFPHIRLPLYLHFQTPLTQLFCPTS